MASDNFNYFSIGNIVEFTGQETNYDPKFARISSLKEDDLGNNVTLEIVDSIQNINLTITTNTKFLIPIILTHKLLLQVGFTFCTNDKAFLYNTILITRYIEFKSNENDLSNFIYYDYGYRIQDNFKNTFANLKEYLDNTINVNHLNTLQNYFSKKLNIELNIERLI